MNLKFDPQLGDAAPLLTKILTHIARKLKIAGSVERTHRQLRMYARLFVQRKSKFDEITNVELRLQNVSRKYQPLLDYGNNPRTRVASATRFTARIMAPARGDTWCLRMVSSIS